MMTWSVSKGFVACLGNLQQTNLLPSTRWELNWWNGHQFAEGLDTTLSKCCSGPTPFPSRFPLLCTFPLGYFLKHILVKLSLNSSHLTKKVQTSAAPPINISDVLRKAACTAEVQRQLWKSFTMKRNRQTFPVIPLRVFEGWYVFRAALDKSVCKKNKK